MSESQRQYTFNPITLQYEETVVTKRKKILRAGAFFVVSLALTAFYAWVYLDVLGFAPPKTAILKSENAKWSSKIVLLNRNLDSFESTMDALQMRNDEVYRTIFGMNRIPPEVLNAGFGGVNRYAYLDEIGQDSALKDTYIRLDRITKKAYVQSKAFDEVAALSKKAGDMASCLPAIPPINPAPGNCRLSSRFGYRTDPVYGGGEYHQGIDLSSKKGTPVFVTGDGTVESVQFQFRGYGNCVVVDHGFGYKTRYAHMNTINVVEGMQLKRGECLGTVGSTGKSTAPHLHYEVCYKGQRVNPLNFFDLEMSEKEYASMVRKMDSESQAMLSPQFQYKSK